jgi:hypothetical protein
VCDPCLGRDRLGEPAWALGRTRRGGTPGISSVTITHILNSLVVRLARSGLIPNEVSSYQTTGKIQIESLLDFA